MDKHILEQYTDLQEEERDLVNRISRVEHQLEQLKSGYVVADSVSCGKRGKKPLRVVKIQGFPAPEYDRLRSLLHRRKTKLKAMEIELHELLAQVDDYINAIGDSRIRRILRYRYIDGLMWHQVAGLMGKGYTEESCRKVAERFLESEVNDEQSNMDD